MKRINVELAAEAYPIFVGSQILTTLPGMSEVVKRSDQIAIITTEYIHSLYGQMLAEVLKEGREVLNIFVPDGEKAKSLAQVESIYTSLLENTFERGCVIIALGGGVIGDLAGFVAATYLRGVSLVQVPTTLLAQVDSSIGGKVGVNHKLGKNLIGAFKQPLLVLSDTSVLKTLPEEELRCGLGEVIKYAFIRDTELFAYLEDNLDAALEGNREVLLKLVQKSAAIKAQVVSIDEREQNLRMILNFGHTFGHALETEMAFSGIRHGEAVILGMQCALEYTRRVYGMKPDIYERGLRLLRRVPIPVQTSELNIERLIKRMSLDKKVKHKRIRLVLLDDLSNPRIEAVADESALVKAWEVLNYK